MITAADLMELVDYDEKPGEVKASIECAPGVRASVVTTTRQQAESAMHESCKHLAKHLNERTARVS